MNEVASTRGSEPIRPDMEQRYGRSVIPTVHAQLYRKAMAASPTRRFRGVDPTRSYERTVDGGPAAHSTCAAGFVRGATSDPEMAIGVSRFL